MSDALPLDATGRVLLVEDDEGLANLIGDYLGRNGLEIHWVRPGSITSSSMRSGEISCAISMAVSPRRTQWISSPLRPR